MDNKNITIAVAAMVALVAVSGVAFSTFAQGDTDTIGDRLFEQKRMSAWQNMSDEEILAKKAEFEERQAGREARQEAVRAALEAGDYSAWVTAHDGDEEILKNINNENDFARLVEAHGYMEQGRAIMEELGIERGAGRGMNKGGFGGHGMCGGIKN